MKSIRQKRQHRNNIAEGFKIVAIVMLISAGIFGMATCIKNECKRCKEEQKIVDSILKADSTKIADSVNFNNNQ